MTTDTQPQAAQVLNPAHVLSCLSSYIAQSGIVSLGGADKTQIIAVIEQAQSAILAKLQAATPASEGQLREAPLVGRDTRDTVTTTLRTEPMADGSWCAHMIVMGLHSEQMANAAMDHMQNLFCGQEIKNSD